MGMPQTLSHAFSFARVKRPCGTRRFPAGSHVPATDVCIACRLLLSSYRTSCDIILARLKLLMLFGHIYGVAGGTSWTF
jgi:hypothetical protein